MDSGRLHYLLERFYNKTGSAGEREELLSYIEAGEHEPVIKEFIGQRLAYPDTLAMPDEAAATTLAAVFSVSTPGKSARDQVKTRRLVAIRWIAAACICFVFGGIAYFLYQGKRSTDAHTAHIAADIAPGTDKALLTLADGSVVKLDSNGNNVLQQGQARVQQNGGILVYQAKNKSEPVSINRLSTPRGGRFQVQLADGTKVWLNAASSLTYPAAFTGKERLVEITGEAYFDVAANIKQPFRVKIAGKSTVEVLGTQFNINAYEDEDAIETTLVDGAVNVHAGSSSVSLKPGQQAAIDPGSLAASVNPHADIMQVTAWKNGVFSFRNADLKTVMRQLSRWYNVEVSFEGAVPAGTFNGEIGCSLTLSQVLEGLSESRIKYTIINNRIIIQP